MTVKTKLDCLNGLPQIPALSDTFNFIDNLVLRENIAIVLQYIIFLINLDKNHQLPGAISYLICKDMIIQTASIAESLLCFGLKKSINLNKTTLEIMDITDDNKYKDFKKIYEFNPNIIIGGVIKIQKLLEPQEMQFNDLIQAAKHSGLIDGSLEAELIELRQARNRIHLSSLKTVDDAYSKATVDKMFKTVNNLKLRIITYLAS